MAGRSTLEFYAAQRYVATLSSLKNHDKALEVADEGNSGIGDGSDYQPAIDYIQGYIEGHKDDDWVTYYNLVAI